MHMSGTIGNHELIQIQHFIERRVYRPDARSIIWINKSESSDNAIDIQYFKFPDQRNKRLAIHPIVGIDNAEILARCNL